MPDKTLTCVECGTDFIFTEAQKERLEQLVQSGRIEKWFEPKRCKACRDARKQRSRSQGS